MREKLKIVWKNILIKDYSEDTIATIMYLLAKTENPEQTLNQIIEILENNNENETIYTKLNKIEN